MRFFRAAVTGAAADLQGFAQGRNPKRLCLSENWDVQKKSYIRIMYQINATNFLQVPLRKAPQSAFATVLPLYLSYWNFQLPYQPLQPNSEHVLP